MDNSNLKSTIDKFQSILWIGALSFEERCTASLLEMQKNNFKLELGILLDFDTDVYPIKEYHFKKGLYEQNILTISNHLFKQGIVKKDIHAYSFLIFQLFIEEIFESREYDLIIVDITCITKLQTLAFAAAISNIKHSNFIIVYTIPENYGNIESIRKVSGWKDILIAPLKETAMLFNEINSRGIIVAGHESDRLIVGLSEIEPSSGLIILSDTPLRPDLKQVSEKNNRKIINQLTRTRNSWSKANISFKNISALDSKINKEIQEAKKQDAPIILFPYGPKPIIFYSALNICLRYPDASWFVYPVPSGYDINYSEGIEQSLWVTFNNNGIKNVELATVQIRMNT
jgi:hypothetical protein